MSTTGLSHLDSARNRLVIQWHGFEDKGKLGDAQLTALQKLHAQSTRPLMILRESPKAKGNKLDDLVCRSFSNEKVQLATQWFNCVKVGNEVLDAKHPLNSLFAGENPPRVILSSRNGKRYVTALSKMSERLDWSDITSVLRDDYKKSPARHVTALQKILVDLDKLDEQHKTLSRELNKAESKGVISKVRRLYQKISKIEKAFKKTLEREKKYKDLAPRPLGKKTS